MEIPVLKASDICHGMFNYEGDTHCLSGWAQYVTGVDTWFADNILFQKLKSFLNNRYNYNGPIAHWNDSHTFEECAQLWNECFHGIEAPDEHEQNTKRNR